MRVELWLEGNRVDAIGMQTLSNRLGLLHELGHALIGHNDVDGGDRLLLIQAPDVKLVD